MHGPHCISTLNKQVARPSAAMANNPWTRTQLDSALAETGRAELAPAAATLRFIGCPASAALACSALCGPAIAQSMCHTTSSPSRSWRAVDHCPIRAADGMPITLTVSGTVKLGARHD